MEKVHAKAPDQAQAAGTAVAAPATPAPLAPVPLALRPTPQPPLVVRPVADAAEHDAGRRAPAAALARLAAPTGDTISGRLGAGRPGDSSVLRRLQSDTPRPAPVIRRATKNGGPPAAPSSAQPELIPEEAAERARAIDAEVNANPDMPLAELGRLMEERNRLLPLLRDRPPVEAAAPPSSELAAGGHGLASEARWAPEDPRGMDGAIPLAAGMVVVPVGASPPPVPPTVLFPEMLAGEGGLATGAAELGTGAVAAEVGTATILGDVGAAGTVAAGSATIPVAGWIVAGTIVLGIGVYVVYRHYSAKAAEHLPLQAPGTAGPGPMSLPGQQAPTPVSAPAAPGGSPASAPGLPGAGPMSMPGGTSSQQPMLASFDAAAPGIAGQPAVVPQQSSGSAGKAGTQDPQPAGAVEEAGSQTAVLQIHKNAQTGADFEKELRAAYELAGFDVKYLRRDVKLKTPWGMRYPDVAIYYKGKLVEYVELKSSTTAEYGFWQMVKDEWIRVSGGPITSVVRPDAAAKKP